MKLFCISISRNALIHALLYSSELRGLALQCSRARCTCRSVIIGLQNMITQGVQKFIPTRGAAAGVWGRLPPPGRYCQISQRLGAELEFRGVDPGVDPDHFQFRP